MNVLRCVRNMASLGGNHLLGATGYPGEHWPANRHDLLVLRHPKSSLPVHLTLYVLKKVLAMGDAKK